MSKSQLVGAWKLVSLEHRLNSGGVIYPRGMKPDGILIYSENDYMSVVIAHENRAPFHASGIYEGDFEEKISAFDSYMSYCGTYSIQGNRISHHVQHSLFPNWSNTTLVRNFSIEGPTLSLSTDPFVSKGEEQAAYIIWTKL